MSMFDNFEVYELDENSITIRQEKLITKICNLLSIEFNGKTKHDADMFIRHNLPRYLEEKEN